MDFSLTLGGWWTVEVETERTMMDLTWDLEGIDGQSLRLGGQRSERMGGEDIGMSAIQKIRPRPSSDKFSVSKYCLHAQKLSCLTAPTNTRGPNMNICDNVFNSNMARGCWKASNMHSWQRIWTKKGKNMWFLSMACFRLCIGNELGHSWKSQSVFQRK